MKKILLLLSLSLAFVSCKNVGDNEFILNGTVKGVADGKTVILERNSDSLGVIAMDTVKIKDGKFKFEGKVPELSMYSLTIEGIQPRSYVILEEGEINMEIDKDSVFKNKLSGTYHNEELTNFNGIGLKVQKKLKDFEVANQVKMTTAQKAKDTATIRALRAQYGAIQKEMEESTYKYIEEHPKSFVTVLLIHSLFNSYTPDTKRIEGYFKKLDPSLKKTSMGKRIDIKVQEFMTVGVGRQAPNFSAPNAEGKTVSLTESMGKVTIIDFWASWCGPCRAANPEMVALYSELHAKGLNIIGVSLDKPGDNAKWVEAIAKDGLTWTQVSNLKHWDDPIAATYGVKQIPTLFVLNNKGLVVAKDIHGAKLKTVVTQLLNMP